MQSTRGTARTVGILFIVATAAAALSSGLLGSILDHSDLYSSVSTNKTRVLVAVLLDLITAGAVVSIPVVMFPFLKQHKEGIARGYFAARAIEGVVIIAGAISLLTLVTLSKDFVATSGAEGVGTALVAVRDWTDLMGTQLVFSVTALILNYSLYQSRLVPRFISVWGLIGAALAMASSVSGLFTGLDPFSTTTLATFLPLALNEMVLAVWLIAKGFHLEQPQKDLARSHD